MFDWRQVRKVMNGGLKGKGRHGRLEGRSIEAFFFRSLCSFVSYHIPYKWSVVEEVEVEVVMVLSNERKRRRGKGGGGRVVEFGLRMIQLHEGRSGKHEPSSSPTIFFDNFFGSMNRWEMIPRMG
jgi:hypothetical protein